MEQEKCWGSGGHYRQITTALLAAVGGNVTAGTGVLVQAAAVNYLQQNLVKEVGNLVAKGTLTEGSPFHASLHALIAAGGAAASGQDVVSAAGGSAAASLLTNLFEPPTPDSPEEEKTAKRHLLTTLVTGIAEVVGGDATAAHNATLANIDNNWLTVPVETAVGGTAAEVTAAGLAATAGAATAAIGAGTLIGALINKIIEGHLNHADAKAVIAGEKSIEQAIAGLDPKQRIKLELNIMDVQLRGHISYEEANYLAVSYSRGDYEGSRSYAESLGEKYLPGQPLGFKAFDPVYTQKTAAPPVFTKPVVTPKKWGTEEKKKGEPAPQNASEPDDEKKPKPPKGGEWGAFGQEMARKNENVGKTVFPDNEIEYTFNSIKDATEYPEGFRSVQNGLKKFTVNNRKALEAMRKIEPGQWHKVYKDGFDAGGRKISIHYFESRSGRVFDVKVVEGWSN